jgi:heterodisulfide reductase subunit C
LIVFEKLSNIVGITMARIIFLILLLVAGWYAYKGYVRIYHNILLGRDGSDEEKKHAHGLRNMLLVAFGQKKMFARPVPAILHLFIYVAFIITQFDLLEQVIDGLFGTHRILSGVLGGFYSFMISFIELLSVLALVGTVVFLLRRNILRVPRVAGRGDLRGWPFKDANLILLGEILLITGIFCMNGADQALASNWPVKYHSPGSFLFTSALGPMWFGGLSENLLHFIGKTGWWLHILVVMSFLVYLPYSKHLHILLAFPNTFFSPDKPRGAMTNMPEIEHEVKNMLGISAEGDSPAMSDDLQFGAHDVFQLSRYNLLNAYTCTECGRCTSVCPANITGKKLSPRKIMMDVRDRADEIRNNLTSDKAKFTGNESTGNPLGYDDGKNLFDYITKEEINACTTCNACVEACPVLINPLDIILQLRRYEILTESAGPPDWTPMFTNLENNSSPWQMTEERAAWTQG